MNDVSTYIHGHDDSFEEENELECFEYRKVVIDYEDFVELAKENGSLKTKFNYILRALRIGIDAASISAIFDDDFDPDGFLEMNFFNEETKSTDEEKNDEQL